MTHVFRRGHSLASEDEAICSLDAGCESGLLAPLLDRSLSAEGSPDDDDSFRPRSNAAPAVFGVFAEAPKAANAPEPSPKADDAPGDGAALLVLMGGKPLALLEESPEAYLLEAKLREWPSAL